MTALSKKHTKSPETELFTPETAFLQPVNVRTEGWTPRAEYCLLFLRENGKTAKDIAELFDSTPGAIYDKHAKLLEARGLRTPRPCKTKPPKLIRVGVGSRRDAHGYVRMLIGFDEDTFKEIRARAERHNTPFAAEVRLLVEFGLDTAKLAAD